MENLLFDRAEIPDVAEIVEVEFNLEHVGYGGIIPLAEPEVLSDSSDDDCTDSIAISEVCPGNVVEVEFNSEHLQTEGITGITLAEPEVLSDSSNDDCTDSIAISEVWPGNIVEVELNSEHVQTEGISLAEPEVLSDSSNDDCTDSIAISEVNPRNIVDVECNSEHVQTEDVPLAEPEVLSDSSDDNCTDSIAISEVCPGNICSEAYEEPCKLGFSDSNGTFDGLAEITKKIQEPATEEPVSHSEVQEITVENNNNFEMDCCELDMSKMGFSENLTENVEVVMKTEESDDSSCEIVGEYSTPDGSSNSASPNQSETTKRFASVIQWAGSSSNSKDDRLNGIPVITIDDEEPELVTVHVKHLHPSMYHVYRCVCCDGLIGHRKIRRLQNKVPPQSCGDYKFRCSSCGNGYLTEGQLKRHSLRHEEKRFRCYMCSKKFCTHRELQSHAVVHTSERPYPCPHCTLSFRQSSSYYSHLKSHIICEVCSAEGFRV